MESIIADALSHRRPQISWPVAVALVVNAFALVWGAATLNATVGHQGTLLEQTTRELNQASSTLNQLEIRVRLLEAAHEEG